MSGRVNRAIEVLVYDLGERRYMIAILEKVWQGARRLDRRLARTTPLMIEDACPPGVQPEIWVAYLGLLQTVRAQSAAHGSGR